MPSGRPFITDFITDDGAAPGGGGPGRLVSSERFV